MRKVIQISSAAIPETDYDTKQLITTALCDDGTMWAIVDLKEWTQLPPIPQPEIAADDVVMPKVGDSILVSHVGNGEKERPFSAIFCGLKTERSRQFVFDECGIYWEFWKANESDPWRDASGKIVEV